MSQTIPIVENIMNANEQLAQQNRARLDEAGIFAVNFMASPGAGKTSLIEQTLKRLPAEIKVAAVDGDIATSIDADRAAAAGATAIQINTGGECHLDVVGCNHAGHDAAGSFSITFAHIGGRYFTFVFDIQTLPNEEIGIGRIDAHARVRSERTHCR